jgi:hypothetical protein
MPYDSAEDETRLINSRKLVTLSVLNMICAKDDICIMRLNCRSYI